MNRVIDRYNQGGLRTKNCTKKSYEGKPLISIITVVFNGVQYLEETIQSVINQTYGNVEYIIIDGGSSDETLDIIKKYDDKIDYWVSERDEGIYDAMNKGTKMASGKWINFMNAGDRFYNLTVIDQIIKYLKGEMVYGNHMLYDIVKNTKQYIDVSKINDTRNIPYCHQSLFIKKSTLLKYPFNRSFKLAADYNQYLEAKYNNAVITHVPLIICTYLFGGVSSTSHKALFLEYYQITKKYNKRKSLIIYILRNIRYFLLGK